MTSSSSIAGIAIMVATVVAIATGKVDFSTGLTILSGAAAMVAIPQNSTQRTVDTAETAATMKAMLEHIQREKVNDTDTAKPAGS